MSSAGRRRTRIVVGFLAVVATVVVLAWGLGRMSRHGSRELIVWSGSPSPDNSAIVPATSPSAVNANSSVAAPTSGASPELPTATPSALSPGPSPVGEVTPPNDLIVPVAGVRPDQLRDTYSESRSEGRVHDAIDIPAPKDTPVLAAADGAILKLFQSERGGTTIYQLSTDKKFVYYYAHLDRYAEGLAEGHFAKQGETIAYVGDSGNAGAGNYHLHFSVATISDPRHYWQGVNINPYPLLKR
jgi:murein DD-endopeptidase MepM/ murein hydrolase activator NlpD